MCMLSTCCSSPLCFLHCGALGLLESRVSFSFYVWCTLHARYRAAVSSELCRTTYTRNNLSRFECAERSKEQERCRKSIHIMETVTNNSNNKRQHSSSLHFSHLLSGRHDWKLPQTLKIYTGKRAELAEAYTYTRTYVQTERGIRDCKNEHCNNQHTHTSTHSDSSEVIKLFVPIFIYNALVLHMGRLNHN